MLYQNQRISYKGLEGKILGFMEDGRICVELDDNTILYCEREKLTIGL